MKVINAGIKVLVADCSDLLFELLGDLTTNTMWLTLRQYTKMQNFFVFLCYDSTRDVYTRAPLYFVAFLTQYGLLIAYLNVPLYVIY